jgi:hypothetical protein
VSVLSPLTSSALAALLLASMWRAFLGRPARRPRRGVARGLLATTGGCYLAGAALVALTGAPLAGALVVIAGIEASCLGAWLVRGADGPGDDGGDDGGGDDGHGPWDWDAFDRARAQWARGRPGRPRAGV